MSPSWLLSASVLMILGSVNMRKTWAGRIAIAPIAIVSSYSVLTGSRGPFFAATSCWSVGVCLAKLLLLEPRGAQRAS